MLPRLWQLLWRSWQRLATQTTLLNQLQLNFSKTIENWHSWDIFSFQHSFCGTVYKRLIWKRKKSRELRTRRRTLIVPRRNGIIHKEAMIVSQQMSPLIKRWSTGLVKALIMMAPVAAIQDISMLQPVVQCRPRQQPVFCCSCNLFWQEAPTPIGRGAGWYIHSCVRTQV